MAMSAYSKAGEPGRPTAYWSSMYERKICCGSSDGWIVALERVCVMIEAKVYSSDVAALEHQMRLFNLSGRPACSLRVRRPRAPSPSGGRPVRDVSGRAAGTVPTRLLSDLPGVFIRLDRVAPQTGGQLSMAQHRELVTLVDRYHIDERRRQSHD
jgi:hypothetical protein